MNDANSRQHVNNKVILLLLLIGSFLSACDGYRVPPPPKIGEAVLVSPQDAPPFLSPEWSPDGSKLLVYSEFDYVHIIDLSNGTIESLQNSDWDAFGNKWSPGGDEIMFVGQHPEGGLAIWLLNVVEENALPQLFTSGNMAEWSPGGDQIVVGRTIGNINSPNRIGEILIFDRSGDLQNRLFSNEGFYISILEIEWSPDGNHIAAMISQKATDDLYDSSIDSLIIINLEHELVLEFEDIAIVDGINWSPDSTKLIFVSSTSLKSTQFFIVNLEGICYQISTNLSLVFSPKISPNGEKIAYSGPHGGIYVIDTNQALGENYWDVKIPCGSKQ